MLKVIADAGLPVQRQRASGVVDLTIPLPGRRRWHRLNGYLNAVAERERRGRRQPAAGSRPGRSR